MGNSHAFLYEIGSFGPLLIEARGKSSHITTKVCPREAPDSMGGLLFS